MVQRAYEPTNGSIEPAADTDHSIRYTCFVNHIIFFNSFRWPHVHFFIFLIIPFTAHSYFLIFFLPTWWIKPLKGGLLLIQILCIYQCKCNVFSYRHDQSIIKNNILVGFARYLSGELLLLFFFLHGALSAFQLSTPKIENKNKCNVNVARRPAQKLLPLTKTKPVRYSRKKSASFNSQFELQYLV